MTEIHQSAALDQQAPSRRAPNKGALIGLGATLVVLTNAVVFVLPPLLPIIQAQYHLATVAETTWLYSALTLGGGAGFILLPRLADVYGDRNAAVAASAFLTVGALILVQMAAPEEKAGMAAGAAGTFMAVGFTVGTALVSGDLSASLVPVPGTGLDVAAKGLYGIGYWLSAVLALLIVVTALISRARSGRRAENATP